MFKYIRYTYFFGLIVLTETASSNLPPPLQEIITDCFANLSAGQRYPDKQHIYFFDDAGTSHAQGTYQPTQYLKGDLLTRLLQHRGAMPPAPTQTFINIQEGGYQVPASQTTSAFNFHYFAGYKVEEPSQMESLFQDLQGLAPQTTPSVLSAALAMASGAGPLIKTEAGTADPTAASSCAGPRIKLHAGVLVLPLETQGKRFTAIIPYGQGHAYINMEAPSFMPRVGFQALAAQDLLSGEFVKAVKFVTQETANTRTQQQKMRHPVTGGEAVLERFNAKLAEISCGKTPLGNRQFSVDENRIEFPISQSKTMQDAPAQYMEVIRRICEGMIRLYLYAPKDTYLQDVLGIGADGQILSASAILPIFKKELQASNDQFLFLNWAAFKGSVTSFNWNGTSYGFEVPLINALKPYVLQNTGFNWGPLKIQFKDGSSSQIDDIRTVLCTPPIDFGDQQNYAILTNGVWYTIPANTIQIKRRYLANRFVSATDLSLIPFDPSVHNMKKMKTDKQTKQKVQVTEESEAIYNIKAVESIDQQNNPLHQAFILDRGVKDTQTIKPSKPAKPKKGTKKAAAAEENDAPDFEFGDVILFKNDELSVMHVKK